MVERDLLHCGQLVGKPRDMEGGEDGMRSFGDIRDGRNLQFALCIRHGVVPDSGEKRSAWMCGTDGTIRCPTRAFGGGYGFMVFGACGRDSYAIPAGNNEQAVV